MKFQVDISDYGHREVEQGEGEWDYSWRADHDYSYGKARIVTDGYADMDLFPGEAEVEPGDDIHIVYVAYSTGDSFGNEDGVREHLWAFSDRKRALDLADAVSEDAEANPEYDFEHQPLMFNSVPIATNTWKGYFERFTEADVVSVTVRKAR